MSDTLASLRHKIDGADKLESVVRTMKVMAAASIGQYEAAARALADYECALNLGLGACLRQSGTVASPPNKNDVNEISAIIFGSDQGLVGQFNEMMAGFVVKMLTALPGRKKIWAVGERIYSCLADAGLPPVGKFNVPNSVAAITPLVGQIQIEIEAHHGPVKFTPVYVFHNRPQIAPFYESISQRLLPLDTEWQKGLAKIKWPTKNLPEVLGGDEETLRALIREYLFISLYKACAESLASENASRLAAMQRAEKNIDDLSAKLTQTFYRLRQSSIDEELFDVIAGFNALIKDRPLNRKNLCVAPSEEGHS
ncbi:MAG TPA: F0F1 ATP synthase subunit gamma [Verrucomicrobiae bacterium]|jgi:F-type H+-transporting ATPase subunit gamma|nr:F0F1 ATP synthase subunit gamma [Verrucomicrobiae bacterium]